VRARTSLSGSAPQPLTSAATSSSPTKTSPIVSLEPYRSEAEHVGRGHKLEESCRANEHEALLHAPLLRVPVTFAPPRLYGGRDRRAIPRRRRRRRSRAGAAEWSNGRIAAYVCDVDNDSHAPQSEHRFAAEAILSNQPTFATKKTVTCLQGSPRLRRRRWRSCAMKRASETQLALLLSRKL
jgi:hypothetical protein